MLNQMDELPGYPKRKESMKMENKTVTAWLQELASKDGKYTGGSAASGVAAISASLAQFIFELQAGKKRYADKEEFIQSGIKRAANLQKEFVKLIERDSTAFEPVLPLYRLPQDTEAERIYRRKKLNEALAVASTPPYEMMIGLAKVVELYEELSTLNLAESLVMDIIIGLDIAIAALKSSKNSSMINIMGITDSVMKTELTEKVIKQYENTLEKAEKIKRQVEENMK